MEETRTTAPFEFQDARTIREAVFQALGAASMCWESPEGAGVFDSTRATEIGETLIAFLEHGGWWNQPLLGFATTKELIDELSARAGVAEAVGEKWPNYKTVGEG